MRKVRIKCKGLLNYPKETCMCVTKDCEFTISIVSDYELKLLFCPFESSMMKCPNSSQGHTIPLPINYTYEYYEE